MKEPIKVTIYCITENNGAILLTEDEGKPGWKLPGGEVEPVLNYSTTYLRKAPKIAKKAVFW